MVLSSWYFGNSAIWTTRQTTDMFKFVPFIGYTVLTFLWNVSDHIYITRLWPRSYSIYAKTWSFPNHNQVVSKPKSNQSIVAGETFKIKLKETQNVLFPLCLMSLMQFLMHTNVS